MVAECGSFTAAAARLHMTPPALTTTIQQFEQAVGLTVFDRSTRRVVVSAAALAFREEAMRLVGQIDGAIGDLMAQADGLTGEVAVAVASSIVSRYLAPACLEFRRRYPGVQIALKNASAQAVETLVLESRVDFAIDSRHRGLDELDYQPLLADRYGVVGHRDLALVKGRRPVRWDELEPGRYVGMGPETAIGQHLLRHEPAWPVIRMGHDTVTSANALFTLLSAGERYGIMPELAVRNLDYPALAFRPLQEPTPRRELCLITRRSRAPSPNARRLLDLIAIEVRRHPLPAGIERFGLFA